MTKIIEWRQPMLSELPLNEDLFVEKFLMEGIQELCRKTQCFTEVIDDVSAIDQATHTLVPVTANSKFVRFMWATYKNIILDGKTVGEMEGLNKKWQVIEGTPVYAISEGGNVVRWSKIPDVAGDAVSFRVALEPTSIEDSDIPEPIEIDHLETVKDYVKWKYYMQPQVFNAQLSAVHKRAYEDGRGDLKISVITGFIGNSQAHQESFL